MAQIPRSLGSSPAPAWAAGPWESPCPSEEPQLPLHWVAGRCRDTCPGPSAEHCQFCCSGLSGCEGTPANTPHGPCLSFQIKLWDIPKQLLTKNLTAFRKELVGHARKVGLVEWHPTAANILFSSGYDYKVGLGISLLGLR